MVLHDDPRPPGPQRREEGHAVPDLDQRVAGTMPADELGADGAREHEVAAGAPDDAVAVARHMARLTLRERRAQRDVEARLRPEPRDGRGVHLGAAGFDVFEVAPRQHVDPADPGSCGQVTDLGDVAGVGRRRVHTARVVTTTSVDGHMSRAEFADAWAAVADVDGWMTEGQARRLWDCAQRLSEGD